MGALEKETRLVTPKSLTKRRRKKEKGDDDNIEKETKKSPRKTRAGTIIQPLSGKKRIVQRKTKRKTFVRIEKSKTLSLSTSSSSSSSKKLAVDNESPHYRDEKKGTRKFWTQQEVDALYQGVKKYKVGSWTRIKK